MPLKTREKTREKIIAAIMHNNSITTVKLAELLNLSEKGVEYQLNKLKKENIISRIGSDNGGYWHIINIFYDNKQSQTSP